MGLRYRVQYGRERVGIAFPKKKLAVFVDGCFWYSCPMHGHMPKSNAAYWVPKLEKNVERDRAKDFRVSEGVWSVLHFWEHEIKPDVVSCTKRVASLLSFNEKGRRA